MKTETLEMAKEIIRKRGTDTGLPPKHIEKFVNRIEADENGDVSITELMKITIEMAYCARSLAGNAE